MICDRNEICGCLVLVFLLLAKRPPLSLRNVRMLARERCRSWHDQSCSMDNHDDVVLLSKSDVLLDVYAVMEELPLSGRAFVSQVD